MENWHLDFPQFLDLRQNSGDPTGAPARPTPRCGSPTSSCAGSTEDADWYLFDPLEIPDLVELYGAAFSARYAEYVAMAEAGEMRRFRKIKAREQFQAILISLQTTSHPWLTWKDTINTRALNNNTGTIHLSNLCTEVCLPQDRDNVAVCNLASINLSRHLIGADRRHHRLGPAAGLGPLGGATAGQPDRHHRLLGAESEHSNDAEPGRRAGRHGLHRHRGEARISYESEQAYELIDKVMEFISFHAIDASADLARERGSYPNFAGSRWSQGMVPFDTLDVLAADRGVQVVRRPDHAARLGGAAAPRSPAACATRP